MRKNKHLYLLFLMAFIAMLMPFFYTSYPVSDDAWQHIQKAICYLDNGGFPFRAFYELGVEDCISFPNYPPLFDVLLGFGQYYGMMLFARFLPSLLAALVVFAFYPLARKFLDERKALLATALAVFAPEFMVLGSTNAQPQILGILFSLLCFNYLLEMMEKRDYRKSFALAAVFSALLVYSYTTYIIFVYGIFFVYVLLIKRFAFIKDMVLVGSASMILSLPVLIKFFAFPPPNAGLTIAKTFVVDSYWYLIPVRVGLPAVVLAFFSQMKGRARKFLLSSVFILLFFSFFQVIAPFPPTRNLAFLLFFAAILGADGWPRFVDRLGLKRHYMALTHVLVILSVIAGIFAVFYFVRLETVTDEEYDAVLWLQKNPGKIATFNWGPFNYPAEMQYNGDIFDDLGKIEAEGIDYVVLTSKTPEIYRMSNKGAVDELEGYCDVVFNEKEVYILECN